MTRYWHYTNGRHIAAIMSDGVVKPADEGQGDPQLVWLSSNPLWEMAASQQVCIEGQRWVLNADQMAILCDGIFRIAVDADRFPLHQGPSELVEGAGISQHDYERQLALAELFGSSPDEWAVSLKPIPSEFWQGIDYWNGGDWIALTVEDVAPLVARLLNPNINELFDRIAVANRAKWVNLLRLAAVLGV
jgi:hypothetical protein